MLPVASVAGRLLKLGGCAPDCGLARPALGGCKLVDHAATATAMMLASLIGWHCATSSGPWRCVSGPPVSVGSGSGVRPPPSHRGWSSSSSVCLHCVLPVCSCLCQRIGSGSGGDQHGVRRHSACDFELRTIHSPSSSMRPKSQGSLLLLLQAACCCTASGQLLSGSTA